MISQGLNNLSGDAPDVCVIGSGPAGITMALELADRGRRVLVLESGGDTDDAALQELSASQIVDERVHDDTRITMARRLGGSSNLWGARCQPFDPIDFAPRPWLPDAAWPDGVESELRAWYPRATALLQCGEPVYADSSLASPRADKRVDVSRIERFSTQPKMQLAHGQRLREDPRIDLRLRCTVVDAELDAPRSRVLAVTVADAAGGRHRLPVQQLVLAMGGLESTRWLLALQRRHSHLFGGPDGPLGRYYMAHVIGEVADIVLASDDWDRAFDFQIDGRGSYARRRFIPADGEQQARQLPNVSFWPVVPAVADARHRSGLLSMVFLAMAIGPIGRLLMAESIRRYHAPAATAWGPHVRNVLAGLPGAVAGSLAFLRRRYLQQPRVPGFFIRNPTRTYGLSYHAEHLPSPDSRVTLTDAVDALGLPRLRVDLRFSQRDAEALFRAHELMREWLASTGVGELRYRQPVAETPDAILACARHGTHQIGTARMGLSAQSAVVDQNLRSFDLHNLHVASSAVFPSSGQANPTLTIVALAARLADRLHTGGPNVVTASK